MASPSAKRARGDASSATGTAPVPSAAECKKMVTRLSAREARAILADAIASSPEVLAVVKAELNRHDDAPVDLDEYASRASEIVWSLDKLRDSQIFDRSGEVSERLESLITECKETLSTARAFQAIVVIMACVHDEAEGQIRKCLLSCGYFEFETARQLEGLAEDLSDEDKASVDDAVEDLERLVAEMAPYATGNDLARVVKKVRGE